MIAIPIILIIISIVVTLVNLHIRHDAASERKSAAERLRRKNSRIVALCKCGAEFVRIDRETEMNFTPFVNGVWPKPVKEGEIFLRCLNGCKNFAECPIRKRLAEPVGCHEFGPADGVRVIKSRTFDKNGTAYFILHDDLEDRRILASGEECEGNDNSLCFVRTNAPCAPAKARPREADDAADSDQQLKD